MRNLAVLLFAPLLTVLYDGRPPLLAVALSLAVGMAIEQTVQRRSRS